MRGCSLVVNPPKPGGPFVLGSPGFFCDPLARCRHVHFQLSLISVPTPCPAQRHFVARSSRCCLREGPGRRCQSSYRCVPATQTVRAERLVFGPRAHPPVPALFSRALSTPGGVTTQAPAPSPIRAHPACPVPSPDTAVPSPKWPAPFGPPRSNTWGFPKPSFSVLACLPLPQNILHSLIHSSKYL